jgi:hypothetical protein
MWHIPENAAWRFNRRKNTPPEYDLDVPDMSL